MKIKTKQQVRVGIFVTIGLILAMFAIFLLGDFGNIFYSHYTLKARFGDISGLREGAPIYLAGIQVGTVEDIRFAKNLEEKNVMVNLNLSSKYQERLRMDSSASIVTQGLLGDKAVFLTIGSAEHPMLVHKAEIKTKTGFSLDAFSEQGSELLENVTEFTEKLNNILGDVKEKESLLHALLYDPEGAKVLKNISAMTKTARSVVRQIQVGRGMLHALIYDPAGKNVGEDLSKTMANLKSISENFKKVSAKVEKGEGSLGGLINDPTVYHNLMTLLGGANRSKILRTVVRSTMNKNEKDLTSEQ